MINPNTLREVYKVHDKDEEKLIIEQNGRLVKYSINRFDKDSGFVTGTAGTSGNFVEWDEGGNIVDSGISSSDVIQSVDDTRQSVVVSEWGISEWSSTSLFIQTSSNTVSSGSLSPIIGSGVGTNTLPENYLTTGKTIKVRSRGTLSLGSGDTVNVAVRVGGSGISTGNVFSSLTPSSQNYEIEVDIVCRSTGGSGSVYMMGFLRILNSSGSERVAQLPGSTVAVDTTTTNDIEILSALSDATNDQIVSEIIYITKEA